ncbi:hypothetical protein MacB4_00700 [Methylacidimicrobium sp. B4]|nr:hypothetical protein MacB4_00700 [Methylacidimicrobium sp. B4]
MKSSPHPIRILWEAGSLPGLLQAAPTAKRLLASLPFAATAKTWREEACFSAPVERQPDRCGQRQIARDADGIQSQGIRWKARRDSIRGGERRDRRDSGQGLAQRVPDGCQAGQGVGSCA